MKYDKFELEVVYDEDFKQIKTSVIINSELVNHYTDLFAFFQHFQETNSREIEIIGKWKGRCSSSFEPFTCSCGVSGCAGIWEGVYQKTRKWTTEWRIDDKDHNGYNFLDKSYYQFHRKSYEQEIVKAWKWLYDNQELIISDDGFDDETVGDILKRMEDWIPEKVELLNNIKDSKTYNWLIDYNINPHEEQIIDIVGEEKL